MVGKSSHAFALNITEQWQYFAMVIDPLWNVMIDLWSFFFNSLPTDALNSNSTHQEN